eukprot:363768-Chlamydomonas_euryale.AAC.6
MGGKGERWEKPPNKDLLRTGPPVASPLNGNKASRRNKCPIVAPIVVACPQHEPQRVLLLTCINPLPVRAP